MASLQTRTISELTWHKITLICQHSRSLVSTITIIQVWPTINLTTD